MYHKESKVVSKKVRKSNLKNKNEYVTRRFVEWNVNKNNGGIKRVGKVWR